MTEVPPAVVLALAFGLPFLICFLLARAGHARTAWWLPGGILLLYAGFLVLAAMYAREGQAGGAIALALGGTALPAAAGGTAGILAGRRRR